MIYSRNKNPIFTFDSGGCGCCESTTQEVQSSSPRCHCSMKVSHYKIDLNDESLRLFILSLEAWNWCAQNWYSNIEIGLAPASRKICTCITWIKPFWPDVHTHKLISLLVLDLKMSITKLNRVSLGTPKEYMQQKCVSLSSRSWKRIQLQIIGLISILAHSQSFYDLLFSFSPKQIPWKVIRNVFCFT